MNRYSNMRNIVEERIDFCSSENSSIIAGAIMVGLKRAGYVEAPYPDHIVKKSRFTDMELAVFHVLDKHLAGSQSRKLTHEVMQRLDSLGLTTTLELEESAIPPLPMEEVKQKKQPLSYEDWIMKVRT